MIILYSNEASQGPSDAFGRDCVCGQCGRVVVKSLVSVEIRARFKIRTQWTGTGIELVERFRGQRFLIYLHRCDRL